ncbi:hypothetical protein G6F70_008661 [Rhizopus microsporus]|uniref:Uncharacterized protein n=1 Tax=Rhizopus microsporus TaxID=58291 RepID=A0A1X0RPT0_RHIZD|nr:hypothetical protein G6F71_008631 [Rhizopus microsporus]KAG1194882.1 hypothetical protein G6F70_008661 [Rhizopus microsporus]KAG1206673.1 hypothetical protein G6F69_008656 [Rhizopus microsporus]ORE14027.1 hypothetical protein BCV71DRAFT_267822 [Rhizopus microsporus]
MENNNQSIASCSSCHAPLPVYSCHPTCQACRKRVAASRHLEADQEEQLSLLMLKIDPEADPGQNLLPISLSFLAFILWTLDEWTRDAPTLGSCCKRGSIQLQLLPDPPEYLKDLLASTDIQRRHFKDNLRQYNAAFAFTSLECDIVSAEERNANSNRGGPSTFRIHDALCHRQGPLLSVEGNTSLLLNCTSKIFQLCFLNARIYRHAYEILSNHESSRINSEDRANNNSSAESGSPYGIISSSMRMHLIEGGVRRIHNLTTMEEVAAVVPIEYIDRNFRDIVLTLRSSSRNDSLGQGYDFEQHFQRISQTHASYVYTNCVLTFHHGTCG